MRWFRSRRSDAGADPPDGQPSRTPEVHASPALGELLTGLHPDRRHQILDLGPAVGSNISFLSDRYLCAVEVVDLYRSLPAAAGETPVDAVARLVAADGAPVDVVLAWDLLNYLEREQIGALAERLAARCRPGARLFAMMITRPQMPREPGTYPIRPHFEADPGDAGDEQRLGGVELVYRLDRNANRPAPRYRPAELEDLLGPGFTVDRNLLLRHGVQEYLAARAGDPAGRPQRGPR